jgi:hypothetical protein
MFPIFWGWPLRGLAIVTYETASRSVAVDQQWTLYTTAPRRHATILIKNKYTVHWTVTVMKYVMSWTDASTFHHDLPFIPLHYTYVPFTSSPQFTSLHFPSLHFSSLLFTSLHFTSLHFTSLHFTSLHSTSLHLRTLHILTIVYFPYLHFTSLRLIYNFPNPFPKIAWFRGESP